MPDVLDTLKPPSTCCPTNNEKEIKEMTRIEMERKVENLQAWEELAAQAESQAEAIKDQLKRELIDREVSEIQAGRFIIRFSDVLSNRFDTTSFKKAHLGLYETYLKQISSKRFSIA